MGREGLISLSGEEGKDECVQCRRRACTVLLSLRERPFNGLFLGHYPLQIGREIACYSPRNLLYFLQGTKSSEPFFSRILSGRQYSLMSLCAFIAAIWSELFDARTALETGPASHFLAKEKKVQKRLVH